VNRVFTQKGRDPFDGIEWDKRKASITDDKGKVIFVQDDIEVPKSWSMLATNIVASKYFYGGAQSKERETSVRQLVHRVARTIADLAGSTMIRRAHIAEALAFRHRMPGRVAA
jgi:ribonucleoside-diphosphate reductase alpha chain